MNGKAYELTQVGAVVGALLASALGVTLAIGVVFAANWDSNDYSYRAGDSNVYFDQCKLSPNTHKAFHNNDQHDIEPTDINTYLTHLCTNEDVRINDGPYGFGISLMDTVGTSVTISIIHRVATEGTFISTLTGILFPKITRIPFRWCARRSATP